MSWLRIDDRMPRHRKVAPLSDAAFRLHVTALAECCESETDGHVATTVPATLARAPQGKALVKVLNELVTAGLWHVVDGGWQIHDFLDWNLSAADSRTLREARAAAGRRGGKRSGEQRRSKAEATDEANAKQVLHQTGKQNEANANPEPDPEPERNREAVAEADASAPDTSPPTTLFDPESAEEPTARARKEQRACRFPTDFTLTDAMAARVRDAGCRNPRAAFEHFRNFHTAKGSKFVDWMAAWRTWCGNHATYACPCKRAAFAARGFDAIAQVASEGVNS